MLKQRQFMLSKLPPKCIYLSSGVAFFLFFLFTITIISKPQDNLRQKPENSLPQVLPASISPTEPYGVNDWNWIDDSMLGMQEMGAKWMRVMVNWSSIEATQGTYNFNQGANNNIDFYISQAQKYGMKVSASVYQVPDWAKQSNLNLPQPNLLANFLTTLLNKYPGKISAIEVLNEENTGSWPATKNRDAFLYVPVLQAAYNAVKQKDSSVIVTTSGLWSSPIGYLEDLYTLGGKGYFDAVNFHYYPSGSSPSGSYTWLISHYRRVMEKYGDGGKPIWLTEFGWNITDEQQDANNIVSPQEQSDYLSYVLDKSMKSGFIGKVFWYDHHGDDGMTLIHTTNNYAWNTLQPALVNSIGSGDTSLVVSNATTRNGTPITVDWTKSWPRNGVLIIDNEKIGYASTTSTNGNTTVLGLTRGISGTTATNHSQGVRVYNQDLTTNFKRQGFYTYKNFIQANLNWSSSQISALPDVPPAASAPISLTNFDFENGITDWVSSLTTDSTQAHSGKASAKVVNSTGTVVRAWHKAVPVEPGKSYFIKGWVKIDPAGSGNMNAMITTDAQDTSGQYLTGGPSNYYIYDTAGAWREVHFPFRTPDNANKLVVYIATDKGTGAAWFDDITIEPYDLSQPASTVVPSPTPNPASASFSLQTGTSYNLGTEIPVKVMAESSTDSANTFVGKINFPAELLSVSRIDTTSSFVTNWTEQYFDNTAGTISLVGAVPNPGYKTTGSPALLATIYLTSKTSGTANLAFDPASVIYRNSDNVNILAKTTGVSINITPPASPLPTSSPSPIPTPIPTPTPTPVPAPANLTASASSYNKVNLAWDSTGITGITYWIIRDNVTIAKTTTESYSDTTVSPSTNYSYQVVATDKNGTNSEPSNIAAITTPTAPDTTAPTAPANLAAVPISSMQINLSWGPSTDNIGVIAYDIYQNDTLLSSVSGKTLSFGATGLNPATTYQYSIIAKDAAGNSSPISNTATAVTLALATPTPTPIVIKGDFSRDNIINLLDHSILLSNWGKAKANFNPIDVDLNSDGVLNVFDFAILKQILIDNNIIRVNP